jgi:hypothetical protein
MSIITILKENFINHIHFAREGVNIESIGQNFLNGVPEDFKVLHWDIENKIIVGSFALCQYHFEDNTLVHIDFLSKETFQISLNGIFNSNPEIFYLSLGKEIQLLQGNPIHVEMSLDSIIIAKI